MNFKQKLIDKLATLPNNSGCYLMKDETGTIIYVGKAINLKNRVNSYFKGAHDYKTTKLVSKIRDFDYIVTKSEKEALILEYNLIKEYDPYFNIVFKDDKSYPYILLNDSDEPYCSVVRLKKKSRYKGQLFGPYPDVTAARSTVDLLNRLFQTRKCQRLQNELCLYYHIKQCPGYCVYKIDKGIKEDIKAQIARFLNGDVSHFIKELKEKMLNASSNDEFEKAIEYRDLINSIEHIALRQDVQSTRNESFDVFSYACQDGFICIVGLFVKNGRLLSNEKHIDYLVGDAENYVSSYLYQFYQINPYPKTLFLDEELLKYFDDEKRIKTVTRGYKYQLLKQAKENAKLYLSQHKDVIRRQDNYETEIKNELKRIFHKEINRIELFDNSHTSGKDTVAAMVVYENLKPSKKDYRMYKLNEGADDLSSMQEVLYRRYFKVLKDNLKRPDLIIVDGAKNQIKIANDIINSLNLDIQIVGLGKDDHHKTAYLMDSNYDIIDIRNDSHLFFLLANMQDEVHRFAINYHKKLRSKSQYHSKLDEIEGLGEKRKTKLLRHFKSFKNIKEASIEELNEIVPLNIAKNIFQKLNEE